MVTKRLALCLLMILSICFGALVTEAQTTIKNATFEVSVVRLSRPDVQDSNLNLGKDRLEAKNLTLQSLLQFAYKLSSGSDDQVVGGPKWMKSSRFDLEGKLAPETAAKVHAMSDEERFETLRGMLKDLLVDRFQLTVHQELRVLPALGMQAIGETKMVRFHAPVEGSAESAKWQGLRNDGHGHIEGRGADLKMLASVLASQPEVGGRLVVDQTGLAQEERFTLDLKWTPERFSSAQMETASAPGPSLFTAMQEQLGLKLVSTKASVGVVIVDHAEMPDEN